MHESILVFRKRRYLWLALGVTALAILAYWFDSPQEPPNGGTVLGYTLGVVATLLILLLAWFGVRKRRYSSTLGTVEGWLSAHVYLGLALFVIALLHSGFQFGGNVHTLAFVLLVIVIVSGIFGVFVYTKIPTRISKNRSGLARSQLIDELEDIDVRARRVAGKLEPVYLEFINSSISRTQLGGTLIARLAARDQSQVVLPHGAQATVVSNTGQEAALDWLAERQATANDPELAATIGELSALVRNKRRLLKQLAEDLRLQSMLEIWLYIHVPMTVALLVALVIHIITVFIYW